jgi:hypothetical protein
MDNLLKPEILVPIFLNIVLAITTICYLLETHSMRKAIAHQLDVAKRQHFVTTAPFLYMGSLGFNQDSDDLKLKINNPSEKLARDVKYVFFDSNKKTYRVPDKSQVVIKPGQSAVVFIPSHPFTKTEVDNKLKKFFGLQQLDKDIVSEGHTSYILLMYTDVEGSVYSVKANVTQDEGDDIDGSFRRQRSRFKKVYDPRD